MHLRWQVIIYLEYPGQALPSLLVIPAIYVFIKENCSGELKNKG